MTPTATVIRNTSKLSNEKIEKFFETRELGYHLGLAQDRYGDGAFMMDWKHYSDTKPAMTPDWNILVKVA
jgi:hypothetical protein